MKVEKNGVACVDVDSKGKPYKIYMGDIYVCASCGQRTTLANHNPAYESFNAGFQQTLFDFDKAGLLIPPLRGILR